MYPRTEYEMTQADLEAILAACKPVPYMVIGGRPPPSQQENANAAWASLGQKMGFDPMTVQPNGKGDRFFMAVPSETEGQRAARLVAEAEERRNAKIKQLREQILCNQDLLRELGEEP